MVRFNRINRIGFGPPFLRSTYIKSQNTNDENNRSALKPPAAPLTNNELTNSETSMPLAWKKPKKNRYGMIAPRY
jgi:hypothetical protein